MGVPRLFLGLLCGFFLTAFGQENGITLKYDGPDFFLIRENASIPCFFEIPGANVDDIAVSWWIEEAGKTLKIGKSRFDSSRSFKYDDAPANVVLNSDRFADGYADLIVKDIGISDQATYACELDDETLHVAQKIQFSVNVVSLPQVTIEDVEIKLDIRPRPMPELEATENPETEIPSQNSSDSMPSDTDSAMTFPAEEATPAPDSVDATTSSVEVEDKDGNATIVKCVVREAYPLPSSITFDARSPKTESSWLILQSEFIDTKETNEDGTFNVVAQLRIVPNANLDQAIFKCSALVSSEEEESENESSPIEVQYLTDSVRVEISPSGMVNENTEVSISCQSNGNPMPEKYLELPNGDSKDVTNGPYTFTATRDNAGTYHCTAANSNDLDVTVMDMASLDVKWMNAPVITGPEVGTEGETVTLECSAEATLGVQYKWLKDGKFKSIGQSLTLSNLAGSDSAEYTCEAMGAATMEATHQLTVETACRPSMDKSVLPIPDKEDVYSVLVTCTALANPECDMWMSGYGDIEPKGEKNKIVLETTMKKQEKVVSITCMASNTVASDNATIELVEACCTEPVTEGLSVGVIIIIVIIVLAVVGAVVGGVYYMKKQRTEKEGTAKKEKAIDDVEADKLNAPTEETDA